MHTLTFLFLFSFSSPGTCFSPFFLFFLFLSLCFSCSDLSSYRLESSPALPVDSSATSFPPTFSTSFSGFSTYSLTQQRNEASSGADNAFPPHPGRPSAAPAPQTRNPGPPHAVSPLPARPRVPRPGRGSPPGPGFPLPLSWARPAGPRLGARFATPFPTHPRRGACPTCASCVSSPWRPDRPRCRGGYRPRRAAAPRAPGTSGGAGSRGPAAPPGGSAVLLQILALAQA